MHGLILRNGSQHGPVKSKFGQVNESDEPMAEGCALHGEISGVVADIGKETDMPFRPA